MTEDYLFLIDIYILFVKDINSSFIIKFAFGNYGPYSHTLPRGRGVN